MEETKLLEGEPQEKKDRIGLAQIMDGSFLSTDFFRQQYKFMLLIVVLLIFYIGNRYSMNAKIAEVDRLKQELTETRYEALVQNSNLMQESRQSHIRQLVEQRGLDLRETTLPPYHLKVKKK